LIVLMLFAAVTAQDRMDAGDPNGALSLLRQQAAVDASDYYNRAYVAHTAGRPAEAIADYLRAERLGGDDEQLRFNLLLALQARQVRTHDVAPPWPLDLPWPLPARLPLEWLGLLALVLGGLACRRRMQGASGGGLSASTLIVCLLAAGAQLSLAGDQRAVATQSQAMVMEPGAGAKSLAQIETGQVVRVIDRQGPWAKIEIAGGLVGWAQSERMIAILEDE